MELRFMQNNILLSFDPFPECCESTLSPYVYYMHYKIQDRIKSENSTPHFVKKFF